MKCRQCGSEIADKAIVCYRCGAPTTDAKYRAPAKRGGSRTSTLVASALALVLLVVAALYMTQFAAGDAPAGLRWLIIVLAAAIVVIRLLARRSRR